MYASTLAALKEGQFALLPSSIGAVVQHAVTAGGSDAKLQLINLLVDECVADSDMPVGVRVAVLLPIIDTLLFLLTDSDIAVVKRAIRGAAVLYPIAFNTIATIPLVDVSVWIKLAALKQGIVSLWDTANDGVRANVIKFVQTIVMVHSFRDAAGPSIPVPGDVSLDVCPTPHPYLNHADLQREAVDAFSKLISLLNENVSSAVVTASISTLFPIIRARNLFAATAVQSMIGWVRNPPQGLTPLKAKNIERAIRNEFLALLSTNIPEVKEFIPSITEILVNYGVKGYEISTRVKARIQGSKRQIVDEEPLVMPTSAPPSTIGSNMGAPSAQFSSIQNFDVQTVPLHLAVDIVVQSMAATPQHVWNDSLLRFGEALLSRSGSVNPQQVGAAPSARDPRRRDPRVKNEAAEDGTGSDMPAYLPAFAEPKSEATDWGALANLSAVHQNLAPFAGIVPTLSSAQLAHPIAVQPQSVPEPEFDPENVEIAELSLEEKLVTWQEAVGRIMELEPFFDAQSSALPSSESASAVTGVGSSGLVLNPLKGASSARTGWMLLLVRLATSGGSPHSANTADLTLNGEETAWKLGADEFREKLFLFILESFRTRYELAILWLHEEYHLAVLQKRKLKKVQKNLGDETVEHTDPFSTYAPLFHRMLDSLRGEARSEGDDALPGLDPKDRTFTKFLIDVPLVTPDAIDRVVKSYCEDAERMVLGFSTLRDLINLRPAVRTQCLDILLSYCIVADKSLRTNAIFVARRWIAPDHATLGPLIEQYAVDMLTRLCGPPPSEEEDDADMSGAAWEEVDAVRHFELFFGICLKKPELLLKLGSIFGKIMSEVGKTILQQIEPLIKRLMAPRVSQDPIGLDAISKLIRLLPEGSEALVKRILEIVTENEVAPVAPLVPASGDAVVPPVALVEVLSPAIVSAVLDVVNERDLDGTYILYIVHTFTKAQVLQYLPKIISILDGSQERERLVESKFLKVIATEQDVPVAAAMARLRGAAALEKVSPAEVLVLIHTMDGAVDIRQCFEGHKLCIKHPEIFTKESLSIVIGQLVESPKIPTLFMRTVLEALKLYPDRDRFIGSILSRLVARSVWKNPSLWRGFVICCKQIGMNAFDAMIKLPRQQFEDVVREDSSLRANLRDYLMRLPHATQTRYAGLFSLLEDAQDGPYAAQMM
ncbi:hypothetical protein CcCBS67573_g02141 [Chytriomyces confervae]|uniref:Symplekin C-terminal domain-containing protein n=1 Tax=Chytriomyces confervae TaxID=246404 RepID=A0A507FLT0_9FUNG|nr:hypothetical protein CcCBS67573_g02141 [Chytriomyces confervae]